MTHKFNEDAANELIDEIGQLILGDEALDDDDWVAISALVSLAGAPDVSGFIYRTEGHATPSTPEKPELLATAKQLQDVMTVDGVSWKWLLVQITLPEFDIKVSFDYEAATTWQLDAEALRPQ